MYPYDELRLRDEVVYLHSLWHQGPPPSPTPPPNPIHLPIRSLHNTLLPSPSFSQPLRPHFPSQYHRIHPFAPPHTRSLPPVTPTTAFKKKNRKKKVKKNRTSPDPPRSPGLEWPCNSSPAPPVTGWPKSNPRSDPPPPPVVSPQEKERLASLQSQNKACQAFKEFLVGSDDDEDEEDSDEDEGDDGLKYFEEFSVRIFMENNELRRYYQECFENGEFCCLVCGAVEKKKSLKKFKDCLGLVQHSMSILRTGNKRAHRGFGLAVCKVLGWDVDRLPTIVMKGEPLGCSAEPEVL